MDDDLSDERPRGIECVGRVARGQRPLQLGDPVAADRREIGVEGRGRGNASSGWRLVAWVHAVADQAAACGEDPLPWRRGLARMARHLNSGVGSNLDQLARALNVAGDRGGKAEAPPSRRRPTASAQERG